MVSRDIVRIARQRAGLTQQQLAERSGHPRVTIARWETGAREPSLASLRALVAACDLDLVVHLARHDPSLDELVGDQLALTPSERVKRLVPTMPEVVDGLRWLAGARTPTIVIGGVAAVLQGGPQPPATDGVEFVSSDPSATENEMRSTGLIPMDTDERWADSDRRSPWRNPKGGSMTLASHVAGTDDYRDLRRAAVTLELDDGASVQVAHPRDLLRMADASPRESDRARIPGLNALLSKVNDRDAR